MKNNDFAVFILTHGRADRVMTYNTLRRQGYTGPVYIVIDNEDKTASEYYEKYGDQVLMFDKSEIAKHFDEADNFNDRRAIVYARNACFELAKSVGVRYFLELDDDYDSFSYKFDNNLDYVNKRIKSLDTVFDIYLDFLKTTGVKSIAMAQGGDFIGGANGSFGDKIKMHRKCMNTFFCDVENPFKFVGRINEDVNTYVLEGGRGNLFVTAPNTMINQKQTQSNKGGMTDIYLDGGTYKKSFYSVMMNPSCVKITDMGQTNKRLHHSVKWNNAVPKIIRQ